MEIITSKNKWILRKIILDNKSLFDSLINSNKISRECISKNIWKVISCWLEGSFIKYKCSDCWNFITKFTTCKSRFCTKCSKTTSEKRFNKFCSRRPQNFHTFHIFFTIPSELRRFFCANRSNIRSNKDNAIKVLINSATQTLLEWFKEKYKCIPWFMRVIHTFGADLNFNIHIHFLVTAWWVSINDLDIRVPINQKYIPFDLFIGKWKYILLTNSLNYAKKFFSDSDFLVFHKLIDMLFKQKNDKWKLKKYFVFIDKKIKSFNYIIKYLWRYLSRPAIWESRIQNYDWINITFNYIHRWTKKLCTLTISSSEFFKRIIRHIPDSYFKMVWYGWIFSNSSKKKFLNKIDLYIEQLENQNISNNDDFINDNICSNTSKTNHPFYSKFHCSCWWLFKATSINFISYNWILAKVKYFNSS